MPPPQPWTKPLPPPLAVQSTSSRQTALQLHDKEQPDTKQSAIARLTVKMESPTQVCHPLFICLLYYNDADWDETSAKILPRFQYLFDVMKCRHKHKSRQQQKLKEQDSKMLAFVLVPNPGLQTPTMQKKKLCCIPQLSLIFDGMKPITSEPGRFIAQEFGVSVVPYSHTGRIPIHKKRTEPKSRTNFCTDE